MVQPNTRGGILAESPTLEVIYLPVDDLVPYERNSKKHPDDQIEQIATSISEFGDCDPIAIWHDDTGQPVIVEGHGRALALQKLGIENAPTISLDHLSDDERRAYSHVHNQTTLSSGLDDEILAAEIDELPEFDWEALGFELPEPEEEAEIPDAPLPEEVETRAHPGELWKMGSHYLYCGDCTDPASVERVLAPLGGAADLLLTDPPYNVDLYDDDPENLKKRKKLRTTGQTITNDTFGTDEEYICFLVGALENCVKSMRPGASYYIWHASVQTPNVLRAVERAGLILRQTLVWVKQCFVIGRQDYQWRHELCAYGWTDGAAHRFFGGRNHSTIFELTVEDLATKSKDDLLALISEMLELPSDVIEVARPMRSAGHPTMKPVPLFAKNIAYSTESGEVVLDPFAGSGTTALACEHLGRRAALIELDPSYCDVILTRWEELAGKTAERCE